jgi:hypothetical protein
MRIQTQARKLIIETQQLLSGESGANPHTIEHIPEKLGWYLNIDYQHDIFKPLRD